MRFSLFLLLVIFLTGSIFYFFPHIDLAVAKLFFTPEQGFFLKKNRVVRLLYHSVPLLVKLFIISGIGLFLAALWHKKPLAFLGKREIIYIMLALALGPGLLVNGVFKEHFGRARPSQIVEFGGTKQFTPAFTISDQCEHNCSFVSGHAAVGFFFITFALLARKRKNILLFLSFLPGIAIGFARMAQGGHFLSDVVLAGLFTLLVSHLLYSLLIAPQYTDNDRTFVQR